MKTKNFEVTIYKNPINMDNVLFTLKAFFKTDLWLWIEQNFFQQAEFYNLIWMSLFVTLTYLAINRVIFVKMITSLMCRLDKWDVTKKPVTTADTKKRNEWIVLVNNIVKLILKGLTVLFVIVVIVDPIPFWSYVELPYSFWRWFFNLMVSGVASVILIFFGMIIYFIVKWIFKFDKTS